MSRHIKDLWLEFELWPEEDQEPKDDFANVNVWLDDGTKWAAVFFTFKNIETLRAEHRKTGEFLSGKYFVGLDWLLIEELTRPLVEATISDLLKTGMFESCFEKCDNYDDETDED